MFARKLILLPCLFLFASTALPQNLSRPEVDGFNVKVGTQTFSPRYQFTGKTKLVETAEAIQAMGSDVLKFYLGKGMSGQYGITVPGGISTLSDLARDEPSVRQVLDLPFRQYVIWTYAFCSTDSWWKDGYSNTERDAEYGEIYAFARYCLTNYSGSGKSFYLGHWEGDWYLLNNYDTSGNPSATAIQGMIDWLNNRQRAVDDAMREVPHTNVFIYAYTEANRVRDAMVNGPANNQRLVNTVLPYVTNLDFVSWSSYDGMDLPAGELTATLDYLANHLSTNKASVIPGRRVIIGEYGWGGSLSDADQEPPTRAYIQRLLSWGPRFILFWEMYNNEPNRAYWLVNSNNVQTPCYWLHERFISRAKMQAARFFESHGQLPDDEEFGALMIPLLAQPLSEESAVAVTNGPVVALSADSATLQGSVLQNVYGADGARVGLFWGRQDGGASRGWEQFEWVGTNRQFNASLFSLSVSNLSPRTNYYYRWYATNSSGETWAAESAMFSTDVLAAGDYGYRTKITFAGYEGSEALRDFPALVVLSTNVPGFSYAQFAAPGGLDLRFTDATGATVIPHEIDEWNVNGKSYVWVRVPRISSENDGIWAFWGNPLAAFRPSSGTNGSVWSPGTELVWHVKETALPYADGAAKHPAISGDAPSSTTAGMVGRAGIFNGTSDALISGTLNVGDRFTLSAWVKVDPAASSIQTLWANKTGGSSTPGFALFVHSYGSRDGKLLLETGNGTAAAYAATDPLMVSTGKWCHVAAVVDRTGATAHLYVNGAAREISSDVITDFATQNGLNLGRFPGPAPYYFKGTLDEVRLESDLRTENWIRATWLNVASNTLFQTVSGVTSPPMRLASALNTAGDSLKLTWPAAGVGWRLYSATNLASPIYWVMATNVPSLTSNEWQISISGSPKVSRFFQIRAP